MLSMVQFLWQNGTLFQIPFLILLSCLCGPFVIKHFLFTTTTSSKNPPPSPKTLPIIGNLHQLSLPIHQTLASLSKKHGPLMMVHLGSTPAVVISSADAAREIIKTHDLAFSSRYLTRVGKKLLYNSKDVVSSPYGEYWRQMRSIFVIQVGSNARVRSFRAIREEMTSELIQEIKNNSSSITSSSTVLNMSKMLASLTFNMVYKMAIGKTKVLGGDRGERFKDSLAELMKILGDFDLGEAILWLDWISRVSGKYSRADRVAKEVDGFLDDVVQERVDHRCEEGTSDDLGGEDLVDVLLKIQNDEGSSFSMGRDSVKAFLLDVFAGGTETTSVLLEWEMSELLKHPKIMKKLQNEIRGIAKGKHNITEDDLGKFNYLKAVVKETLRLHPSVPIPVPRESRENTKVMGYDIEAKTMVMINLWAIGRDPKAWEKPDEFLPERFLDSNNIVDFRGQDFHFIPFGAGRRGCPGISFAATMNEIVLANLIYKFDWELPDGMSIDSLDMTESNDFTIHKKVPLHVVAIPYSLE